MGKKTYQDVLQAIDIAYDTAFEGRDWTAFLTSLTDSIGANTAMLRMVDYTNQQVGFFDTVGYDPAIPLKYRDDLVKIDPYRDAFEVLPVGKLVDADAFMGGRNKRLRGDFYNIYERPLGMEYILGAPLARAETASVQVGVQRNKQGGEFGLEDKEFLGLVFPHLARAVRLRQLLERSSSRQMLYQAALDKLSAGVAIVDDHNRILFVNSMAEKLVVESKGALSLSGNYLSARGHVKAVQLCRMIAEAAATSCGQGISSGGEICITCEDGSALQLCVTPMSRQHLGHEFSAPLACAAVLICRPGNINLPWRRVARCYGLTPAEAKLAVRLARGEGMEASATHLQISPHTARTQLKSVFAKTGCKRQSELVVMLLQGVLAMCKAGEGEEHGANQ